MNALALRVAAGAGLVLLVGGLIAWLRIEREWRHRVEAQLVVAEANVAGRDAAIEALQHRLRERMEAAASREVIVRRVRDAPSSRACADSPAIRALLAGMRELAAGGGGARVAAGVPGGAAASSR